MSCSESELRRKLQAKIVGCAIRRTTCSQSKAEDTQAANELIDSILAFIGAKIKEDYNDAIQVPDINERFSRRVVHVDWEGGFWAGDGVVSGTSSISRAGDAHFQANSALIDFGGTLKFTNIKLVYGQYKADLVKGRGPKGRLSASLSPLSVDVKFHVNLSSQQITLDDYRIKDVGRLNVELTGLGKAMNWLVSRVSSWLAKRFRQEILVILQDHFANNVRQIFANINMRN